MAGSAKATTSHEEIKKWAEKHGGHPACVKGTGDKKDPGMIRIDFPGFSGGDSLERISWEEWFNAFEENKLALLIRDEDRFNKIVSRDHAESRQ